MRKETMMDLSILIKELSRVLESVETLLLSISDDLEDEAEVKE